MTNLDARRLREKAKWDALQEGQVPLILVGTATCGRSAGALELVEMARSRPPWNGKASGQSGGA